MRSPLRDDPIWTKLGHLEAIDLRTLHSKYELNRPSRSGGVVVTDRQTDHFHKVASAT